jgi:hypothetical protein
MELGDALVTGDHGERREAEAIWSELARDAERVTSTLRVVVLERLARLAAARKDRPAVEKLIGEAAALPIDSNERRQIDAEVFALGHRGPAAAALYAYFFVPTPSDERSNALLAQGAVIAEPELGFAHYLLGLQRSVLGLWGPAAEELDRALELGLPGPLFVRNAARRLAVAAYRSRDAARVGKAIASLRAPLRTKSGVGSPSASARSSSSAERAQLGFSPISSCNPSR